MNLFQKYGIKEVADVVFYSINEIGDEEFYTPVLYLDTLKVSTLEKTSEKVFAQGGYGNKRLIGWNFGKEITLTLEDALFSPASMSLIWGGQLNSKLSDYTSIIVKGNLANKYGFFHYSIKAYPSPSFTDEEWELIFKIAEEERISPDGHSVGGEVGPKYIDISLEEVKNNRKKFINNYFKRKMSGDPRYSALPELIIRNAMKEINTLDKIGYIDTKREDTEVIDRMEKCIVTKKEGFVIDTQRQKENLFRYYANDDSSSYTIYYDAKTMLPLLHINNDMIVGWDTSIEDTTFKLKLGTIYYKWTRTIKRKKSNDDSILGRQLIINAETFPDSYRIVGETYIREQKTGKDQRYQFTIFKANVSADTNVTLQADGDPTTFSMSIDVLTPPNDIMMELKEYDVEEDLIEGGTRIVPQKSTYTYTPAMIEDLITDVEDNNEMY